MLAWSKEKKKWDIFINIFDNQLSDLTLRQTLQAFSYFCDFGEDECREFIEEYLEDGGDNFDLVLDRADLDFDAIYNVLSKYHDEDILQ